MLFDWQTKRLTPCICCSGKVLTRKLWDIFDTITAQPPAKQ